VEITGRLVGGRRVGQRHMVEADQGGGSQSRPTGCDRRAAAVAPGAVAKDAREMAAQKVNGVLKCLNDRTKNSEKEMGGFRICLYLSHNRQM
jgi:hypothetical protein